ncbi:precorrin-6A synthase (deacetylating) [Nocardioides anomalus]|uniref:Precorrin-6A synthase (Deacetylating) n=1 Tax=Nocardioides anomalus TaxID=2712223 RepID=A0A6G6WLI8_9ACTN|nr:precorrin-6A synthase (deacetylating) [Nocardioides anomalus]
MVRIVGIGCGPQHVTPEASAALRASAYVVAARKGADDPLLAVRREVAAAHGLEVVEVDDPTRDRDPVDYGGAVRDWHAARAAAWSSAIAARAGDPAFLVWGDPALYDSTIRVVTATGLAYEVVAGISAPQLLAARHGIVLHEVGAPVHVTTERRLAEDVAAGQTNVVVMLTSGASLDGLDDWSIWWGANLGAASERLVAGRVGDVRPALADARAAARAEADWVMDVFLLRAPR